MKSEDYQGILNQYTIVDSDDAHTRQCGNGLS